MYYIVEQFLCVGLNRTTMMFVSFFLYTDELNDLRKLFV